MSDKNTAPAMSLLFPKLGIRLADTYILQPGADQVQQIFPQMQGMEMNIVTINFAVALGRRFIVVPFHCHPYGEGRGAKTKIYSLRSGCCQVIKANGNRLTVTFLGDVFDKVYVGPGEWHAVVFNTMNTEVEITLSVKDDVPPLWTHELSELLLNNPTTA